MSGKSRIIERKESVGSSVHGWSETSRVNPTSVNAITAREGETEVMPQEIGEMYSPRCYPQKTSVVILS